MRAQTPASAGWKSPRSVGNASRWPFPLSTSCRKSQHSAGKEGHWGTSTRTEMGPVRVMYLQGECLCTRAEKEEEEEKDEGEEKEKEEEEEGEEEGEEREVVGEEECRTSEK